MRRQTRARKAILWGVLSFVGVQLGLAVLLAWGPWPFLRDPMYGYKAVLLRHRLAGQDHPFSMVLLGSSRSMRSVNLASLERPLAEELQRPVVWFNFAQLTRGPASHELYLRRLLRQGLRPDLLLVEIHPLYLAGQAPQLDLMGQSMQASWLLWEEASLIEDFAGPQRPDLLQSWVECWALPAYGHRLPMLTYLAPWLLPPGTAQFTFENFDAWGDLRPRDTHTPTAAERRLSLASTVEQYKEHLHGFRLGEAQCRGLRRIAAICQREGIALVWLIAPEGPLFRSWYPPGAREQVLHFIAALSADHATPIIDATDWLPEEDFWDSHHPIGLAGPGYSERLAREGILPLLSWGRESAEY